MKDSANCSLPDGIDIDTARQELRRCENEHCEACKALAKNEPTAAAKMSSLAHRVHALREWLTSSQISEHRQSIIKTQGCR